MGWLYSSENIAKRWKLLVPTLYYLPNCLATRTKLLVILQIKEKFEITKLLSTMVELKKNFDTSLSQNYHKEVDSILAELNTCHLDDISNLSFDIVLPNEDYVLYEASSLSYNDVP